MDPASYGERIVNLYDALFPSGEREVELLAELAAPGNRVLELGAGTGRLALPLALRGLAVTAVDLSPAMLARLASKPGGDRVKTVVGDMATVEIEGEFDLVFCAFNTFYALLTQAAQIACLERAARRLAPGGKLLLELFIPDLTRFTAGQSWRVLSVEEDKVVAEASRHDQLTQRVDSSMIFMREGQPIETVPIHLRYTHLDELDLMARVAGLVLRERFSDWGRQPFGPGSRSHVSVYARS